MKWTLRFHGRFQKDLRGQLSWLAAQGEVARIDALRLGLEEAWSLLRTTPHAGAIEGGAQSAQLRRLILRKVPYVIWYVVDESSHDVWVLRIFHARQRRRRPNWPPASSR
jgi:plasmid stabilization system protein ParE